MISDKNGYQKWVLGGVVVLYVGVTAESKLDARCRQRIIIVLLNEVDDQTL